VSIGRLALTPWACEPKHLTSWLDQTSAVLGMMAQGMEAMSPRETFKAAVEGKPTIGAEIVDGTAYVPVQGMLVHNAPWWALCFGDATDYLHLREVLGEVAQERAVDRVVLRMDSPGGSAMGLTETVAAIRECQAAGKPVEAHVSGLCCSAAYFLASECDQIVAEADSMVGSIGTYCVLADTTGLQERVGIKLHLVSSGGVKGLGADGQVTEEALADHQETVDAYAATFRAQVANGRDMTSDHVLELATGQVWLGAEAVEVGLVDQLTQAAAPAGKESHMDAKQTAALIAANPIHAVMIAEMVAADADEAAISAAIADADQAGKLEALTSERDAALADASAKDEQIAALSADLEAVKKERDEIAAERDDLKALRDGSAQDPGNGDPGGSTDMAKTDAEIAAMSVEDQAAFFKAGGKVINPE
jgi:capsid assembly protease